MTPTEKGRRRDALLYGFDTRLQLCDMIANREGDLEDALADNAKLVVKLNAEHLVRQNAECENAKLRELVLVLKNCADENGDCDACPINDAKPVRHPWFGCDALRDMMRELGVEVNDG